MQQLKGTNSLMSNRRAYRLGQVGHMGHKKTFVVHTRAREAPNGFFRPICPMRPIAVTESETSIVCRRLSFALEILCILSTLPDAKAQDLVIGRRRRITSEGGRGGRPNRIVALPGLQCPNTA